VRARAVLPDGTVKEFGRTDLDLIADVAPLVTGPMIDYLHGKKAVDGVTQAS